MFGGFFQGRRVFVTGHTGFKGAWLALWLKELGATVSGFALDPPTAPNLYEVLGEVVADDTRADIREGERVLAALQRAQPEVVFHLAAQPLVRRSYSEPLETVAVNIVGTANLLEAIRHRGQPCTVIVATSDKCYENREWDLAYRENDPLGGHDVYSMSKAAAELVTNAWRQSFFRPGSADIRVATARAGNVIGGGDYAADRIVPDCVRCLQRGEAITVRNPHATRPWQHVLEPLSGYLALAARLASDTRANSPLAAAFNFGPGPASNRPVAALVDEILRHWPGTRTTPPSAGQPHEAARLNLAIDKAVAQLEWAPVWDFATTVRETMVWYRERHLRQSAAMLEFSRVQIASYAAAAAARRIPWA